MAPLVVVCSVALTIAFILLVDEWLVGHFRSVSVTRARRQLATRDIKGAITTFDSASTQHALMESISSSRVHPLPSSEDIIRLVTPMQACNDGRFIEAVQIYSRADDHLSHQLALELRKQTTKIGELERSIATLESNIRSYLTLWNAPAEEFGALMGLPPIVAPDALEIPHYSHGILASLPKLDRIEDGIETLVALREAIQKAGGTVAVHGSDAAEQFAERLRLLRNDCEALIGPFDQLRTDLSLQKTELTAAIEEADRWCKKGAERSIDELSARIL